MKKIFGIIKFLPYVICLFLLPYLLIIRLFKYLLSNQRNIVKFIFALFLRTKFNLIFYSLIFLFFNKILNLPIWLSIYPPCLIYEFLGGGARRFEEELMLRSMKREREWDENLNKLVSNELDKINNKEEK